MWNLLMYVKREGMKTFFAEKVLFLVKNNTTCSVYYAFYFNKSKNETQMQKIYAVHGEDTMNNKMSKVVLKVLYYRFLNNVP